MDTDRERLARMLLRLLSRFIAVPEGTTAVMFALSLPAILGMAGLAIDVATMAQMKARLQAMSDAAAMAAARELSLPNSKPGQIKSVVANNVTVHADKDREPVSNIVDIDYKTQQVRVELVQPWVPVFAQFLDASVTPIKVHSTARLLTATTKTCVLALEQKSSQAIHLDKDAVITANDCGIYANSGDREAIRLDERSRMKASLICATGGIKMAKAHAVFPEPLSDCPQVPDPLALRSPPPVGGCGPNKDRVIKTGMVRLSAANDVFCGGLTIAGDAEVTFDEGDYVIKDGPLKIEGNAKVKGENVGFYLVGNGAVIDCKGEATVSLSGRKTGPMAGLLFFEDRGAPLRRKHTINCANANELTGTIYLPRGILRVDPNASVAEESAYTAIVVNQIEVDGGPDLVLNADYESTDVPVPEGIRSAGTVILTQ